MVTIININNKETAWPLDEWQIKSINPNSRTYFLRWDMWHQPARITSSRIYSMLGRYEVQKHIENLHLFHNDEEKLWVATFNERALQGMAQSCWGVGLIEAELRSVATFPSMPAFELVHPYADYQLVAKGAYLDTLQN